MARSLPQTSKPPAFHRRQSSWKTKPCGNSRLKPPSYRDFTCFDPKQQKERGPSAWQKSRQSIIDVLEDAVSASEDADYKPVLVYQAPMMGHIGLWDVKGIADLISVWPSRNGKVKVRIFEIKSSWKEQTAHRIQVAIYVLLLTAAIGELASKVDFEGGVINKESDLENLAPESLPSFRLDPLIQDVQRLLSVNGELFRIHKKSLCDVEYQLSWRCDNCGYNECCVVRAVEKESVALLNLTRGEQKALRPAWDFAAGRPCQVQGRAKARGTKTLQLQRDSRLGPAKGAELCPLTQSSAASLTG